MTDSTKERLQEIEDTCREIAKDVINKVCNRASRSVNKLTAALVDPYEKYPSTFRVFDILSVEFQTKGLNDMGLYIANGVEKILWQEYEKLPYEDKFFVIHSECTIDYLDDSQIYKLIYDRFCELLNEHWVNTKKIQNFEDKKSW